MTIDEAKKEIQDIISTNGMLKDDDFLNTLINSLDELKDIRNKYEAQADVIAQMEQELNWWREQDLIRREDVLNVYNSDLCLDFDRKMCESTPNCRCCNIMRIPKAEPPKE